MKQIQQRLAALREVMQREGLHAFIFPSSDPHNSEYTPDHWKGREWISGFNGSAGTAVVTLHEAALWTDSRYFIAAADQLDGTEYVLMKERMPETPTISEWLGQKLATCESPQVGIDGNVCAASTVEQLTFELRANGGINLRTNFDPLDEVWTDRPALPQDTVSIHPIEFAGESCHDKLSRIRKALANRHVEGHLITALDDVAWTLNLRGNDVHCCPVFVAYLLVAPKKTTLFVDKEKLTEEVETYLKEEGITIDDYANVGKVLKRYGAYNILIDADATNYNLYKQVKPEKIVRGFSPVPQMKAVKNEAEQEGFRRAMLRDGVALVKFLRWLKTAVVRGGQTEMSIDSKLTELRAEQELYMGKSFDTVAGYEAHGAIVHYEATAASDATLSPGGMLLLDSGAQYKDGTTDITRTIALGPVGEEQRRVYTLVLKSHIQLEMLKFPEGAAGTQLDAVARNPLWRKGMNYLHGTGHGVGSYLNVHEGPQQIRMEWKPAPMMAGMTITDEPGLYLEGRFGVRIENVLLVVPYKETSFGRFLQFEPLTLCPIDKEPIVKEMLTFEEKDWLNSYHKMVYEKLSPLLSEAEKEWLAEATAEL